MMILTAALLSLGNMARGEGTISHGVWLGYAGLVIASALGFTFEAVLWFLIVVILTIRATGPTLLIGINGDTRAIVEGFKRNCWIIPALAYLGSWLGLILLLQGALYYACGRLVGGGKATRVAEGITCAVVSVCMSV